MNICGLKIHKTLEWWLLFMFIKFQTHWNTQHHKNNYCKIGLLGNRNQTNKTVSLYSNVLYCSSTRGHLSSVRETSCCFMHLILVILWLFFLKASLIFSSFAAFCLQDFFSLKYYFSTISLWDLIATNKISDAQDRQYSFGCGNEMSRQMVFQIQYRIAKQWVIDHL